MSKRLTSVRVWSRFASSLLTLSVFLIVVIAADNQFDAALASPQSSSVDLAQERKIELQAWSNAPVKIVGVRSNGKDRPVNTRFKEDDDDWVKGLTLKVKNISDKNIVYVEAALQFPRPENAAFGQGLPVVIPLSFGDELFQPGQQTIETKNLLKGGDRIEIPFPDNMLASTRSELSKQNFPQSIKHIKVRVTTVIFEDGVIWHAGGLMRRDPKDPQRWEPIPQTPQARTPLRHHETFSFIKTGFAREDWDSAFRETRRPRKPIVQGTGCVALGPTTNEPCLSDPNTCRVRTDSENIECPFCSPVGVLKESRVACKSSTAGVTCPTTFSNIPVSEPCPPLIADGTCNNLADYFTYPSTGCITGLIFGGPCTRSATFQSRCLDPTGYDQGSCSCPDGTSMSPIVIDVDHSGFSMTDAAGGVVFNILNDGVPLPISWTAAGSTNGFLVLDRNGNGLIDSGTELFGDMTPQPTTGAPNGFLALAEYDKPVNGGNGTGRIESSDAIFTQLRLWQDANHNGVSEANEVRSLPQSGLSAIDLDYKETKSTDTYGNKFRYRAKVYGAGSGQAGRWAWDVFLTVVQ